MNSSRLTPHASPTDLLAAVVTLAPAAPTEAPASLARAAHAWLLQRIGESDPALAARLHDDEGPRPFTVSNLWGAGPAREGRVTLDPEHPCWLRFTGLTAETSAAIERALPAPGEILSLAEADLRVTGVATDTADHPWAGRAAYTDLMQRYTLTPGPHPRGVTLRFASPTAFRSHGRDLPLPLPGLVFDGLLRKWNAFSPLALPEEAKRYAEECVALGRFRLRSHWVSFEEGNKGAQVGFTGEVRFRFLVGDGYWTRVMTLLAGYAFWAGVGYRTTAGMGQTQAVVSP
ncbi:MAG TPA: CRISPR system precrRNA processing endoribonuclease RAMP protein Cas6 [Anaerolineae bacterium]|nr:CRISPR system precrRNA processing endoribonuclease RAMP protein Cas6 [Anaerolineae bacterium]HQK14881.1 CRISPR system precrRNA processing endoribonuclease RAMP protein Cas6 [Anaerolineae bacterium]